MCSHSVEWPTLQKNRYLLSSSYMRLDSSLMLCFNLSQHFEQIWFFNIHTKNKEKTIRNHRGRNQVLQT